LKALVESAFTANLDLEGQFRIKFDECGNCPFQTDDKLCLIQKELGAEYLSRVCKVYPRRRFVTREAIYRCCNTSCPVTIKELLNNKNSMDLINLPAPPDQADKIYVANDNSVLKYRGDLIEFYYELISDKKIPVESALILGALAAQKLTEIAANKQYKMIPEALKAFRKQFHNAAQLKSIENIKSNYHLKFGFLAEIIEKVILNGAVVLLRDETGTLNIDLYNKGEQRMHEMLKDRDFFLRNLALNMLFELAVPLKFSEKTIFENYSLFVAAFGCLKLNLIAVCSTEMNINFRTFGQAFKYIGDNKLIGMSAIICRGICQSDEKARNIIARMNENKFTTPAYLALLVK
ncbi:MAG: flagellin lysine-N-methylase, partial [Oscillospiraceae bacterium]|nr:flagellin lysine-N-methylase [Oscillospiraceae bacterium]